MDDIVLINPHRDDLDYRVVQKIEEAVKEAYPNCPYVTFAGDSSGENKIKIKVFIEGDKVKLELDE